MAGKPTVGYGIWPIVMCRCGRIVAVRHCLPTGPRRHRDGMTERTLYRLAGVAGLIGGALIVLAVARRGGVIPENALTHALAPPASALLLLTLTALYLSQRDRAGRLGLAGFVLNHLGLAGLFAIEFLTHAVLQYQDAATRDQLVTGPGRPYFLVVALTFLAGVLLFGAASWRAGVLPRGAIVLYVVGLSAAALRTSVPEAVYLGGLLVGSAGVLWLAQSLIRLSTAPSAMSVRNWAPFRRTPSTKA
jgi:hypothetical protein